MTLLLSLILTFAPPAQASPVKRAGAEVGITLPAETKVYVPVVAKLDNAGKAMQARFKITPKPAWQETLSDGAGTRFTGTPGVYHVAVLYVDFDAKLFGELEADCRIVGDGPKPPDPPGPGPGPVDPSPFDAPGLRVIFLFRDQDYDRYVLDQKKMVRGQEVRDYFARVLADGKNGYRIYQVGVDVSQEEPAFLHAIQKLPPSLTIPSDAPYLLAGNGKAGYAGPAPKTVDDLKAILKKLGASE